ncbi:MAG TPA: 2-amino-4-hydroxy-6-hydroxymethyldihydropteridine diphosphokinase [Thermoanaerobaculia bacterium]|nr:2-amino-4-hydroxy-6-hydroxymethyldihydropteridine diphosphokinase [Thermoanaerobaculia bacterium]
MGLGANLGRKKLTLARAARGLAAFVDGLRLSSVFRTEPVGGAGREPDYLNAAAVGTTRLSPEELLDALQELERQAGRERVPERNAPRTLDLDVLLYGARRIRGPRLTVPHPRLAARRFALAPLAELAPRRVVPGTGRSVASLLAAAPPARVERAGTLRPAPAGGGTVRRRA